MAAYLPVHIVSLFLVIGSLQWQLSTAADQNSTKPLKQLYFMFMTSRSAIFNSSGSVGAIDIVLERINSDPTLLPGYQLNYPLLLDSQCDRQVSLSRFFSEILAEDNFTQYIALLGAGCSVATIPVAEIVPYYNMPMISYASTAEVLGNRGIFKTYFRTDVSESTLVPGFGALIKFHEWRQVTFITQDEALFTSTQTAVIDWLRETTDIMVTTRVFPTDMDPLTVNDLYVTSADTRIFMLNMYSTYARRILCEAYHNKMYYPRYAWILYGWYLDEWWKDESADDLFGTMYICNDDEMFKALNKSMAVLHYPLVNDTIVSDSGLTLAEFREQYTQQQVTFDLEYTETAVFAYDAVWALALALNTSIAMVNNGDEGECGDHSSPLVSYANFTYTNSKLLCILKNNLQPTNFQGLSGVIQFDKNGNRNSTAVRFQQYRILDTSDSSSFIWDVAQTQDELNFTIMFVDGEGVDTLWPDGIPPDGIAEEIITTVIPALSVICGALAVIGIAFSIVCLLFNVVFRKRRVVRLTSPNLNYLIIVGAILLYVSVIVLVIPTFNAYVFTILCNVHLWLFSVGNTMCFAVVLSKLARVYYIFTNPKPNKKIPKDRHLLLLIVVLCSVDILILLVPTAIDSARLEAKLFPNSEKSIMTNDRGVMEQFVFYYCVSSSHEIWLGVSYSYKLLLQAVAIYFAFRTRRVKIKALNDSKQIAATTYITSLILIALVGIGLGVGESAPNAYVAIVGGGRLVYPTVILAFVFIPKMIHLYKDPKGSDVFNQPSVVSLSSTDNVLKCQDTEKISSLEKKINELETKLKTYETAIITDADQSSPEREVVNDLEEPEVMVTQNSGVLLQTNSLEGGTQRRTATPEIELMTSTQ